VSGAFLVPFRPYQRVTREVILRLLGALSTGYSITGACSIAGMSRREFYSWLDEESTESTVPPSDIDERASTNRDLVELAKMIFGIR
jgi:hypothetical protein